MSDNVYEGKTLEDLLKDINEKTGEKRVYIKNIIEKIMTTLDEGKPENVIMVGPVIKDYLELLVHVDEHYIKLATIVQRIISAKAYAGAGKNEGILSDEERDRLFADAMVELKDEYQKIETPIEVPNNKMVS